MSSVDSRHPKWTQQATLENQHKLVSAAELYDSEGGFWVFGYGSLMWRPGFTYQKRHLAVLSGYRRDFCLWSIQYRGSVEAPGLVLGLYEDPTAQTHGVAFYVGAEAAAATHAYLIEREMATAAYYETLAMVDFQDLPTAEEPVRALAYVIDPRHPQCASSLNFEEKARIIASASGDAGRNCEYLRNTVSHLQEYNVPFAEIKHLQQLQMSVDSLQKNK